MLTEAALVKRQTVVSVLFSEPKIPQFESSALVGGVRLMFQCSSASRKFLNLGGTYYADLSDLGVSVLFSEPKIPQFSAAVRLGYSYIVSVLFSEPKIPQSC